MVIGAPGSLYWTGSVLVYNISSRVMSAYLDNDSGSVKFGSYLGYSVGTGHFLHPSSTEIVGGAPQFSQTGKVFIFTVDDNMLRILAEFSGDKASMLEASFQLAGRDSYAARFGETIADLGDIDQDGYNVGAPQEEDLKGAIYIYNGRKDGISQQFSQRICGADVGRDLMMFGQSLNSGVDIDNNGYKDVAVGAYLSDSAVVLRTRPVVRVEATLLLPDSIDPGLLDQYAAPPAVNLSVCFTLLSAHFKGLMDLKYSLVADLLHKPTLPNRFYFHGNRTSNQTTGRVRARHNQLTCTNHLAYLRRDTRDVFTKVLFRVSYALSESSLHRGNSRSYPPLKPVLQHSLHGNNVTSQVELRILLDIWSRHQHPREMTEVNCFSESFNYTYKVLNIGPSRSVGTVVEVDIPSHSDRLCERLVCNLGNLEPGSEVSINVEIRLNPAVLHNSPGRHSVMLVQSSAILTSPINGDESILLQPQSLAQVVLEAYSFQKPSGPVKLFIIIISLVLGSLILSVLIYCLWKAGFFKREFQKEAKRDSWDYGSHLPPSSKVPRWVVTDCPDHIPNM
ncbi:hypothetical protein NHX12_007122 [Muraenolepis orangiensis]|uniref:Integrin alpha first immunoglubulin-like domain-containing protein n=1 Tax=Muraenolepis orangiensis TaxID=630683 RepID=A0A9Q0DST4_9TELE|nr:hypothetical protein NHX12_007122 [Muraenolepis orangiensis]